MPSPHTPLRALAARELAIYGPSARDVYGVARRALAAAATTMATSPGAMQLRTLQTLDGLGSSPSNTVILAVPVEVMEAINALKGDKK